jgi:hypothetical protein
MKKFINVRNIIIILIILLVVFYLVFMRSRNPRGSKTYAMFYDLVNKDVLTMKLDFKAEDSDMLFTAIFSSDKTQNKSVTILDTLDYSADNEEYDLVHITSITITENGKSHVYQIHHHTQTYYDFGEEDATDEVNSWLDVFNTVPSESKYYTKSHEVINGESLLVEAFPEKGYKFYYKDNELKYTKQNHEDTLYTVTFENNFIDESLTKIPEEFTLLKDN